MTVVSWAQAHEDIYLLRALRGVRHDVDNGFYIDIGAHDPESDSVTKLFYDHGWHGINVDASPTWYGRLVEQRPRDINIHAAVTDTAGELTFYDHSGGGLGTLVESIASSHRDIHNVSMAEIKVQSITLTEICERHAPPVIHFLKVDVEGAEGAVLRSMDFARFRPWVLCVESHVPLRPDLQTHEDWDQLLLDAGYRFVFTDMINRYYVANECAELAVNFAIPVDQFMYARDFKRMNALEQRVHDLERAQLDLQAASQADTARRIAEAIAFKGDDANGLFRAFIGTEAPTWSPPQPTGFSSSLCHQSHFGLDQYRFWVRALKDRPRFYRKQWEFVFISQVLFERGFLRSGKRGLVFGAGQEPLPALFASFGAEIVASDQAAESASESGWSKSAQHTYDLAVLNQRGICIDKMFTELVSYQTIDMNSIPRSLDSSFDFCWSACSLEHLGSLQHGLDFMENAMRTLKPGGIAVHTTEFNITSNENTRETPDLSIYRRRDIEAFMDNMRAKGFVVPPVDWTLGEGFAETVVDFPPFGRGEPHIRLQSDGYDVTSIALIIEKPLDYQTI